MARRQIEYTTENEITLIHGGRPYFDLLEELVNGATRVIFFQTYIFEDDETGKRVANTFARASQRGVQVYILLDGYASQRLPKSMIDAWKKAGIHFRWFSPAFRGRRFYVGRRLHHKVLTIDGFHGLVGGINISDRYNDMPDHVAWLDWAVHVRGQAAAELHNVCSRRALRRLSRKPQIPLPDDIPKVKGPCPVKVRVNDWVRGRMEITKGYHDMIRHAKTEVIMMSSYFLPGRALQRQIRLAAARGVKVKAILAGHSDVPIAKLGERYLYHWLLKVGVEVYEYQRSVLHAKVTVCDGAVVTIGSYNLNELSARASVELNLEVNHKPFGEEVCRTFDEIIQRDCIRITSSQADEGFFTRVKQVLSYQLLRLTLFLFTFYFRQHRV